MHSHRKTSTRRRAASSSANPIALPITDASSGVRMLGNSTRTRVFFCSALTASRLGNG